MLLLQGYLQGDCGTFSASFYVIRETTTFTRVPEKGSAVSRPRNKHKHSNSQASTCCARRSVALPPKHYSWSDVLSSRDHDSADRLLAATLACGSKAKQASVQLHSGAGCQDRHSRVHSCCLQASLVT